MGMIADTDNAQIAMPLRCSCLAVFLVTLVFRSMPPEQTLRAAAMLDKQQRFWIDRLLPGIPPLTMAQLRQAALPIKDGGLGHTVLSDVVQPAYLGSRLDIADAVAALPGMRDAVAAMQDCSTLLAHHVAATKRPHPSARPDGVSRHSEHRLDENATHLTESRSRVPRTFRLADQACEYYRRFSDGSH
jgi:hypothetical protein